MIWNYLKCKFLGYCSIDGRAELLDKKQLQKAFNCAAFIIFFLLCAQIAYQYMIERKAVKSLVMLNDKVMEYEQVINAIKYVDTITLGELKYICADIDTHGYKEKFEHLYNKSALGKESQQTLRKMYLKESQ